MARRRAVSIAAAAIVFLGLLAPESVKADVPISTDLVSCWDFEEVSGTRYDSAGSNHLTDVNTVNREKGEWGFGAKYIVGNAESLQRASNSSLIMGNIDFTVAAWFYLPVAAVNYGKLVSKFSAGTTAEWSLSLRNYGTGNLVEFFVRDPANAYTGAVTPGVALNAWHFAMGWYDSTADKINVQVDNGTIYQAAQSTGTRTDDGAYLDIGGPDQSITIDTAMIWTRILTETERQYLYNDTIGRHCSDILVQPTPTPSYRQDVILSSGNHLAVDRTVSYGDVSLFVMGGAILVLAFIFGVVRITKLWF